MDELQRLAREVEDLQLRMRQAENLDTPMSRALALQAAKLQEQVSAMDTHGTRVTQVQIRNISDAIAELKADVKLLINSKADATELDYLRKTQESSRAAVRLAVIVATLSLVGSLILWAIVKASGG